MDVYFFVDSSIFYCTPLVAVCFDDMSDRMVVELAFIVFNLQIII